MLSLRRECFYQSIMEAKMNILPYILLGIAIDVAIVIVWCIAARDRNRMTYNDYLKKYGSVADSHPELYSNYNDYM